MKIICPPAVFNLSNFYCWHREREEDMVMGEERTDAEKGRKDVKGGEMGVNVMVERKK